MDNKMRHVFSIVAKFDTCFVRLREPVHCTYYVNISRIYLLKTNFTYLITIKFAIENLFDDVTIQIIAHIFTFSKLWNEFVQKLHVNYDFNVHYTQSRLKLKWEQQWCTARKYTHIYTILLVSLCFRMYLCKFALF